MSRARALVLGQSVLSIVVLLTLGFAPGAGILPVSLGLGDSALSTAAFAAAALVLGLYSVWLPRGDQADTTGPIAFAAAVVLHPLLAVAAIAAAQLTSSLVRSKGRSGWSVAEYLSRRILLVVAASVIIGPGVEAGIISGDFATNPRPYLMIGIAALAFTVLDLVLSQLHASLRFEVPFIPLLMGNLRLQGWMAAAELSVATLTVFIYPAMRYSALLVTVGLLLVMRQSFALLLEVRASYTATVEVIARALEAYDPERRGHAERVAGLATEAGRMLGFQGARLEDLNYAALFHDVGRIGADDDADEVRRTSSEVLAGVGFLSGSAPILEILDSALELQESADAKDLVCAYVIAHLSARDDGAHGLTGGGDAVANAIGSRIYSGERRGVDRVLRRLEQRSSATEEGALSPVAS